MNKYDSEKINELANSINIADFIEQYQEPCNHNGKYVVFHCNNNSDTTGSLVVNTEKNFYKCYSCESGTNALSYLIKEQHMSYYNAARTICEYTGNHDIEIQEPSETMSFFKRLKRKNNTPQRTSDRVYQDYAEYDKLSKKPSQLWIDEGISAETQRIYDVRTQPEYNRILYPVYDTDKKFICSKARSSLPKDILEKLGMPKYRYLGKIGQMDFLTGLYVSEQYIKAADEIIIVEGIKSCMKLFQYGFKNSASAETCYLNKYQVNLLLQMHVKNIVIAFDQDRSEDAMLKNTSLLRRFANVYIVVDKNGLLKSKDSPVDEGAEIWKQLYNDKELVR